MGKQPPTSEYPTISVGDVIGDLQQPKNGQLIFVLPASERTQDVVVSMSGGAGMRICIRFLGADRINQRTIVDLIVPTATRVVKREWNRKTSTFLSARIRRFPASH